MPFQHEMQICLTIIVITYQTAENEEKKRYCHKVDAERAELRRESMLRELHAFYMRIKGIATTENYEGRARANHQRVGENSQRLDEPLLHRMGSMRCCGSVRRRALPCLVAEEPSLHSLHNC